MPLRIVADSLTDLPEGLRETAKQREGGGFVVDTLAEGWAVENIAGLKKSLSEARGERDTFRKTLAAFGDLSPDVASEAREALEKLRAGQLRGSKEIDEYKASIEKKMADERAALEGKLKARTEALRDRMIRGELAPVIAKLGGGDSMDAILTLAERSIRLEEAPDGTLRHSIVDAAGKPRVTKKGGSADPLGLDELIVEMREAPSTRGLFKVSATGGSGGSSQSGGSGRSVGRDVSQLSPTELIALGERG